MTTPGSLGEVFADLELRFVSSLSEFEINSAERLFFHLEQAWWYYEDELSDHHKHLPHYKLDEFGREFFKRSEILAPLRTKFDQLYAAFKDYQHRIPVYGGALLTSDLKKVLLVSGYRSANSWGFPKGKINQGEDELICAIREVYEETGFDASYLHPRKEDSMLTKLSNGKQIKIFIIPGVPEDFKFYPVAKKEISDIRWWPVDELFAANNSTDAVKKNKFWGVSAFVPRLRRWIAKKQNVALPLDPQDEFEEMVADDDAESGEESDRHGKKPSKSVVSPTKPIIKATAASMKKVSVHQLVMKTPATTKPAKTASAQKKSGAKNTPVMEVTKIFGNVTATKSSSNNEFSIDFGRVRGAMAPFLN